MAVILDQLKILRDIDSQPVRRHICEKIVDGGSNDVPMSEHFQRNDGKMRDFVLVDHKDWNHGASNDDQCNNLMATPGVGNPTP